MTRKQHLRWALHHARHVEEAAALVYIDLDDGGDTTRAMQLATVDARRIERHLAKLLAHLAAAREARP
jgi:hypothetical protein